MGQVFMTNLIFQWLVTTGLNTDVRHFHFETNISQVIFFRMEDFHQF